jgi:hypothetical protein
MATKPLSPLQAKLLKLLRLVLDSGAADGEVLNALSKLRDNLREYGPNPHELVDALQNAGLALEEEAPLPPGPARPDYGLSKIPFGKSKGQLFMDTPPYELRRLREWCLKTDATKFRDIIHDIEKFLNL